MDTVVVRHGFLQSDMNPPTNNFSKCSGSRNTQYKKTQPKVSHSSVSKMLERLTLNLSQYSEARLMFSVVQKGRRPGGNCLWTKSMSQSA